MLVSPLRWLKNIPPVLRESRSLIESLDYFPQSLHMHATHLQEHATENQVLQTEHCSVDIRRRSCCRPGRRWPPGPRCRRWPAGTASSGSPPPPPCSTCRHLQTFRHTHTGRRHSHSSAAVTIKPNKVYTYHSRMYLGSCPISARAPRCCPAP